jgi:hypothetical protein
LECSSEQYARLVCNPWCVRAVAAAGEAAGRTQDISSVVL